jgi:hypothetical protein
MLNTEPFLYLYFTVLITACVTLSRYLLYLKIYVYLWIVLLPVKLVFLCHLIHQRSGSFFLLAPKPISNALNPWCVSQLDFRIFGANVMPSLLFININKVLMLMRFCHAILLVELLYFQVASHML